MADTVQLRDPDQLRAYAAKLAEVRQTLTRIGAQTHTPLSGALAPIDEQSYPQEHYSAPPDYIPPQYGQYAQGYGYHGPPLSPGWRYLSYIKTHFDSLAYADDGLVASLTQVAGSADRTVAAQATIATEAALRLPETDAGAGAGLQGVLDAAVAAVPPPPAEPGPDPRFVPRSKNRPR